MTEINYCKLDVDFKLYAIKTNRIMDDNKIYDREPINTNQHFWLKIIEEYNMVNRVSS